MKKSLIAVLAAAATLTLLSAKPKENATLMVVNGEPVPVSEFLYLYNKNNTQQSQQLPMDEYLKMFEVYKLKVADAKAAGIDTTAQFQKEFNGYRNELARPYLRDESVEQRLIKEAYDRMLEDVDVSHIMVTRGSTDKEAKKQRAKLDSIKQEILNGADFGEMALKYSTDPGARRNKGHMGWMTSGQYPYTFEYTAYNTPIGVISDVIDTDFGHHIVKVNGRRPARGQVLVEHILKLFPRGKSAAESPETKAAIDSIYVALLNGADFEELAQKESEDPGSARMGGRLPWFGTGRMVPEFEEVSFSLNDGEMSQPFATSYGWHIVKKLQHEGTPSFDKVEKQLKGVVNSDIRASMPEDAKYEELKKKYNAQIDPKGVNAIMSVVKAHGSLDSTVVAQLAGNRTPLLKAGKNVKTVGDEISHLSVRTPYSVDGAETAIYNTFVPALRNLTIKTEMDRLSVEEPDFRNLENEYRDGMLLFEISNRTVWEKAAKDTEGLKAFFNANRDKYKWDAPKYKGFIIFTPNDSVETVVKAYIANNNLVEDSVAPVLRREFGRDIKVEKVIASKGENAIVDAVAFEGEKPEAKSRWVNYFGYMGRMISAPEEATDVRGQVTTDYQGVLEEEWEKALRAKYPIKLDNKIYESLKK